MRYLLLLVFITSLLLCTDAQEDRITPLSHKVHVTLIDPDDPVLTVFPVPVRENYFNLISSKEIIKVKITNIIGQDIFNADYSNSQSAIRIILDNPRRGIYLVTVRFSDNTMIVKKIMIEGNS
jgi:hypothetical protein